MIVAGKQAVQIIAENKLSFSQKIKSDSISRDTLRDRKQATEKRMDTEILLGSYFWLSILTLEFEDLKRPNELSFI